MEIKEAIKLLNELNIMTLYDGDSICDSEFVEALKMAITALGKREAKKPIVRTKDIDGLVEGHRAYRKYFDCPNCDSLLKTESWTTVRCFGDGTMLKDNSEISFCPQCGQKINWSEVEDG